MIVDALGNSVAMSLTPGQASDLAQAEPLLDEVEPEALLADKAYDANALIDTLEQRGITPVIPSKANRIVQRHTDFALYRERNLVERFFGKLKGFPRYRNPLRQARQHIPRRNPARLRDILAQLTTRPRHPCVFRAGY